MWRDLLGLLLHWFRPSGATPAVPTAPAARTFIVPLETRTFYVALEDRTFVVPLETRTLSIKDAQ